MKITKVMKVAETLRKYPEVASVFERYELRCFGCPMSEPESLEEAAEVHGLDIGRFLKELNSAIKKKKTS